MDIAIGTSRKRTMPDKKILGIPVVTFAVIFAMFLSVIYYATGYASENEKLLQKYNLATTKILSISRMVKKLDSDKKQCASELKRYEDSNNELTLKLNRCEKAKQEEEVRRSTCDSQVLLLQKIYLSLKTKVGLSNSTNENIEPISEYQFVEIVEKVDSFKDSLRECEAKYTSMEKNKNELQSSSDELKGLMQTNQDKIQTLTKEKGELEMEVKNVRTLNEEAEKKISTFEEGNIGKLQVGFKHKKPAKLEENVHVEILPGANEAGDPAGAHKDGENEAKSVTEAPPVNITTTIKQTIEKQGNNGQANTTPKTTPKGEEVTEKKNTNTTKSAVPTSPAENDDLEDGVDDKGNDTDSNNDEEKPKIDNSYQGSNEEGDEHKEEDENVNGESEFDNEAKHFNPNGITEAPPKIQ